MKKLDLTNTPLCKTSLVEASAGTGKTYTIEGLFVRLVLEEKLPVDRVLVVTFTKAATQELKERIRNKLFLTKEAFIKGQSSDILIDTLVKNYKNSDAAVRLLHDALIDFDRAAIFTIHGFCQRILHENAFETQSLFDTDLLTDESVLIRDIADDFWRKNFYNQPREFIGYCNNNKIFGPDYFVNLQNMAVILDVKIIPEISRPSLDYLEPYRNTFQRIQRMWPSSKERVGLLLDDYGLSKRVYGKRVVSLMEAMGSFLDEKSTGFPLFSGFEKFTATKIKRSVKKNNEPPSDEFFDACDSLFEISGLLEDQMAKYILFLKAEFFRYAKKELFLRKKKKNIQFYDDLLTTVKNALEDSRQNFLLEAVRNKYKAALVDEFQDTDPVQYTIFSRLFSSKGHLLFLIGDPKQAIYGFRGADIFSYLDAAKKADFQYTLKKNWRSDPGLICAVNTIFSNVDDPFIFDEILFEKTAPGRDDTDDKNRSGPPFILWYLSSEQYAEDGKPINKGEATNIIADAVSEEIRRLVYEKNEKEGDIAVLVRTNRQALVVQEYLLKKNIRSVLYNSNNIFDTDEAGEMETILASISEPNNEMLLKAALVTDIMGVKGDLLDSVFSDPKWWVRRVLNFQKYKMVWEKNGFLRMFHMVMASEEVKKRLLTFPDGERRLTNLLHLSEILHQVSVEKGMRDKALVKWLSGQRSGLSQRIEEYLLRIESDEHAVKIVTIHKSKGLEYKVVFCAFAWESSLVKDKEVVFHDNTKDTAKVLDIGSKEFGDHLQIAQKEMLAENLRLLYVALTRAKTKCYLIWGRINTAQTSAPSYLFHSKEIDKTEDIVPSLANLFLNKSDDVLLSDLKKIEDKSKGTIKIVPLSVGDKKTGLFGGKVEKNPVCRQFSGNIDTSWGISSYTSLVSTDISRAEIVEKDSLLDMYHENSKQNFEPSNRADIFSFPRGAQAGIFFHDIFENLDFVSDSPCHRETLVENKLNEYGFDLKWKDTVCRMITKVLTVPLLTSEDKLTLSSISSGSRINEMEFYFPLKNVSSQDLQNIIAEFGKTYAASNFKNELDFSIPKGFMKGFIDLVFFAGKKYYLLDWKSNFLGESIEAYNKKSIDETMNKEFYILQYYIYAAALDLYLKNRLSGYRYEKDFGGVFYVFIRGVDPAFGPEYGIFYDLPKKKIIDKLTGNI